MMRTARAKGFDVVLVYIGTEDVEINLARIAKRVQGGGHDVPEVDVRRRYRRSFDNLPVATTYADHSLLFDNSSVQGYQLVALLSAAGSQWFEPLPRWAAPLRDLKR
jgi:predicted ABC-type ATPase